MCHVSKLSKSTACAGPSALEVIIWNSDCHYPCDANAPLLVSTTIVVIRLDHTVQSDIKFWWCALDQLFHRA